MTPVSKEPADFVANTDVVQRPRYVENKRVNASRIQALLERSAKANQWSNFGPVSQLLEEKLTACLGVPDDLRVVACANATIAIHALVAMHNHLHGRELRWVTSAFGFYSSIDGILHTASISDCDQQGMLDLSLLNPDDFDGLIVTNIFGQYPNLAVYEEYAKKHQKVLLIDGAMAFQRGGHGANECISLHHTKPWGFGEGGCAIVSVEHAELFKDLLSFGHHSADASINRLAINGKISDVACAYLMMRLDELETTRKEYQRQFHRIYGIGAALGLSTLSGGHTHPGMPANVPFLFPKPTGVSNDPPVPARKYYFPLDNSPVANGIYQRIVNIACHSEMVLISDAEIKAYLSNLLKNA